MHIHARSNAEQRKVVPRLVSPSPVTSNSDIGAMSSARGSAKQDRAASSSATGGCKEA